MSPAIHRPASSDRAFVVPGPRVTDAVGKALRDTYADGGSLPVEMAALLGTLDRVGRA